MDKTSVDTILQSFEFLENSERWRGASEIVQRDVTFLDGNTRRYIDIRLRIGTRWLTLPRRGLEEIIQTLVEAKDQMDKLSPSIPPPKPQFYEEAPSEGSSAFPRRRRVVEADRKGRRRNEENE